MARQRGTRVRPERVAEQLRMDVAKIVQHELKDPRLGLVTCTRVKLTADLKQAKIYVSVLGDDQVRDNSMTALASAIGFVRRRLAARLNMRVSPEIEFVFDPAVEYGIELERLLDAAKERDAEIPPDDPEAGAEDNADGTERLAHGEDSEDGPLAT